jgi:cytochrome c peroxidase
MRIEDETALFVGGNFWDGRATGERFGDPLAEQAQGPFVNPVEQALPDTGCVVRRVCAADYPVTLESQFPGSCGIAWPPDVDAACAVPAGALRMAPGDRAMSLKAYDHIATAVAAYERSREVNPFSSKFDHHLAGRTALSAEEAAGLELFVGRGKCANCHPVDRGPDGQLPLLTDFTFDNLGVPPNPENPWFRSRLNPAGVRWADSGIGAFLATRSEWRTFAEANLGKHKVPTLRNVDRRPTAAFVKAYVHNGYFKTLSGLVHFYNTRDVKPVCRGRFTEREAIAGNCWPAPEVMANVNTDELGNLGLSQAEERAIVAFLKTLSDGFVSAAAERHRSMDRQHDDVPGPRRHHPRVVPGKPSGRVQVRNDSALPPGQPGLSERACLPAFNGRRSQGSGPCARWASISHPEAGDVRPEHAARRPEPRDQTGLLGSSSWRTPLHAR